MEHVFQGSLPSLGSDDPRTTWPWWVVSHVLIVPAIKFSNPMMLFVLVKTNDATNHQLLRVA